MKGYQLGAQGNTPSQTCSHKSCAIWGPRDGSRVVLGEATPCVPDRGARLSKSCMVHVRSWLSGCEMHKEVAHMGLLVETVCDSVRALRTVGVPVAWPWVRH